MTDKERIARWCGWEQIAKATPDFPYNEWRGPKDEHTSNPPTYDDINELFADIGPIERAKALGFDYWIESCQGGHRVVFLNHAPYAVFKHIEKDPVQAIQQAVLKLIDYLEEQE